MSKNNKLKNFLETFPIVEIEVLYWKTNEDCKIIGIGKDIVGKGDCLIVLNKDVFPDGDITWSESRIPLKNITAIKFAMKKV